MKSAIIFTIFAISIAACVRRPVQQDVELDHNSMDRPKINDSGMQSSPGASDAPFELQFLDTMIAHHQGAIDMAQLVKTRAKHNELKSLAVTMIAQQQKEVEQMKDWRAKWFGERAPAVNIDLPGMRDAMKGMDLAKLDSLKENAFDLEFIRQMIPHHEGAVAMARYVLSSDTNAELKGIAENIVKAQEAEIKRMKEWQTEWAR